MSETRLTRRAFLFASAAILSHRPTLFAAADPKELQAVIDKGYAFLKSKQKDEGNFGPPRSGEPGVTALAVAALIRCGKPNTDPVVEKGLAYLEKAVKKDGGVYDQGLANYTTSLAVMAFKDANADKKYDAVIAGATKFLRSLQYGEGGDVAESDAKFGGAGYDKKGGRGGGADLSNTHFFLEALVAGGAGKDDPAVKRAVTFLSRSQNLPGEFNDQEFAKKAGDEDRGGFIYNMSAANDPKSDKRSATGGLRSEGGMTYAGLKSFLYAGVSKEDARVKAAVAWVKRHYTLKENPGMGTAGLFYYYHVFAKAMDALGEESFEDAKGVKHDWRNELFTTLKGKQKADGSWANDNRAFLETLPELATAFALLALSYCKK
jgi:squalene-hopene/tetraprenyl-beta-curcumene cyclase